MWNALPVHLKQWETPAYQMIAVKLAENSVVPSLPESVVLLLSQMGFLIKLSPTSSDSIIGGNLQWDV